MGRVKERYSRRKAEARFARVYQTVDGSQCLYCGMPSDGKVDHQPPVYVLHRFADGGLISKRQIRERFGECKLVPCCTICNMGLGAYDGEDDNDRRREILNWFLVDEERYPGDEEYLSKGYALLEARISNVVGVEVYKVPAVGRAVYIESLMGFIEGRYSSPGDFPDSLKQAQVELAEWLRQEPRRKSQYFLDMAKLVGYELLPHARDNPRGQNY